MALTIQGSNPWKAIGIGAKRSGHTASDDAFLWASRQLQECILQHDTCSKATSGRLPTRLLDLAAFGSNQDVKLYESQSQTAQYICLSHCWGAYRPLKLEKATLEVFKSRIPWTSLPLTFQDAISFTRRLGMKYIWIDSLCIIQDDRDDWARESANMAAIYHGSLLTLAATRAESSSAGMFARIPPEFKEHELVSGTGLNGIPYSIFVRIAHGHQEGSIPTREHPLLTRAWVFQERLLSSRVLHFGHFEMLWECAGATSCECLRAKYIPEKLFINQTVAFKRTIERNFRVRAWHGIIQEYTKLNLSYHSDRLPALSGLAKAITAQTGDQYLAGLWKSSFLSDISWKASYESFNIDKNKKNRRPAAWRAPSWSWVSVEAKIYFHENGAHPREDPPEILEVHCVPSGLDPTGELESGYILTSCHLLPATLQYNPQSSGEICYSLTMSPEGEPNDFAADYELSEPGETYVAHGDTIYMMYISTVMEAASDLNLVLRCVDTDLQKYERIGIGMFWEAESGRSPNTVITIV
ncbi:HET-domain-containing protein [Glonium stellatum]|uniref:HET-domain-containing protein n=1 Tax=Glonium stellatum TaxID=574774 RepID=A0A8E2JN11_9PEZI|nr:HET-domain-containing protein [Glonium stellatum]